MEKVKYKIAVKLLLAFFFSTGIFILYILFSQSKIYDQMQIRENIITLLLNLVVGYAIAMIFSKKGKPTSILLAGILCFFLNMSWLSRQL